MRAYNKQEESCVEVNGELEGVEKKRWRVEGMMEQEGKREKERRHGEGKGRCRNVINKIDGK